MIHPRHVNPVKKHVGNAEHVRKLLLLDAVDGASEGLGIFRRHDFVLKSLYPTHEESTCAAGKIRHAFPNLRLNHLSHEIRHRARRIELSCGTGGFLTSWMKQLQPKIKTTEDQEAFGDSIYGIEKKQFPYMLCVTNMLLHEIDVPRIYHDNSLLRDVLDYTDDDKFDVILMNPPYGGSEKASVKQHFPADLASSETADLFMAVIMYRLKDTGRAAVILPDGFLFGNDNAKVNLKKKLIKEFNLHTIVRMPGSVFSPYTSITTNILFFDKSKTTEDVWFYRMDMPEGYKHFSKTKPMKLEHFDAVVEWWNDRIEIMDEKDDESISESWKAKSYTAEEIEAGDFNLDLCGFPQEEKVILSPEETIKNFIAKRDELDRKMDAKLQEILELLGVE